MGVRLMWLGLVTVLAVGCGSHPAVAGGGRGELPACVDPRPAAVKPMVHVPVRDERFTGPFGVDHDALLIEPTDDAPGVSYQQARCTLLSAFTVQGLPLTEEIAGTAGISIGLGVVRVRPTPSYGYEYGTTGAGSPTPPAVRPFRERLVWAAVIRPTLMSSCPSFTPGHLPRRRKTPPDVTGDQVLLLDARTGATGMIYDARSPGACFGGTQAAQLTPLVQAVSVPWTMVRRAGNRATIAASARRCDGIDPTVNVDRFQPGLVRVQVLRPVARCGSAVRHELRLLPPTLYDPLPTHVVHARIGAWDVAPQ